MIKKYCKEPVVVEAIQYTIENFQEIADFVGCGNLTLPTKKGFFYIETLEGSFKVCPSDYIIKGILGEVYLCKPDIFKLTYEEV